jgi:hypothetical protein
VRQINKSEENVIIDGADESGAVVAGGRGRGIDNRVRREYESLERREGDRQFRQSIA